MEDKEKFVEGFFTLLQECDDRFSDIANMQYHIYDTQRMRYFPDYLGEFVTVTYKDGHSIDVDVTADSITALVRDLTRAID